MDLTAWYKKRGMGFILERAKRLNQRYSLNPRKSIRRIESCLDALRSSGCSPTFAVPGMVVERNRPFIRRLQELGAEIAVHGYNHIDLKACPPEEASSQLQHAAEIFWANGLEVRGFRCPYLSVSDALLKALPEGVFEYSSNQAILWPYGPADQAENVLFDTILGFYTPEKAETALCLPWFQDGLVEIPVCVPDDLQLLDGLGYQTEQVAQVWLAILQQTHRCGELFNLMFHPELASFCEAPFITVLKEALSLQPTVWVARLRDISTWWKEKAGFRVEIECADGLFSLLLDCTERATILIRGFDPKVPASPWDGDYSRIHTHQIDIEGPVLPFVGLPEHAPRWAVKTLIGMGYIIDMGETAQQCSLYVSSECLAVTGSPRNLVEHIERSRVKLIRFWPWPDGARSALCISGDLDALSFQDYAFRLLKR